MRCHRIQRHIPLWDAIVPNRHSSAPRLAYCVLREAIQRSHTRALGCRGGHSKVRRPERTESRISPSTRRGAGSLSRADASGLLAPRHTSSIVRRGMCSELLPDSFLLQPVPDLVLHALQSPGLVVAPQLGRGHDARVSQSTGVGLPRVETRAKETGAGRGIRVVVARVAGPGPLATPGRDDAEALEVAFPVSDVGVYTVRVSACHQYCACARVSWEGYVPRSTSACTVSLPSVRHSHETVAGPAFSHLEQPVPWLRLRKPPLQICEYLLKG